jgi:DNA-binding NtrC family response regulator
MRILVVDDEPDILGVLSTFLTGRGYEVTTAASGKEAIETVANDPEIGVVLLDVVMYPQNGIETLKELTRRDPHPDVIMMTARADEKVFDAVRLGAVDYVLKPIDLDALASTVSASFKRPSTS